MQYASRNGSLFYYDRILYSWEICEPTMLFLLGFESITTFDSSQTDTITISKMVYYRETGVTEEMSDFPTFDDILTFLSTNGQVEDSDYYIKFNCYGLKLLMNELTGTSYNRTVPAIYRNDINKKLTDPSKYKSNPGDSYYDLQAQRIINTFKYAGYNKSDNEIPEISIGPDDSEIKDDINIYNSRLKESHELKQSCGQVYKLYDYKSMYSYALGVLYGLRCLGYDKIMIWTVEPRFWYFGKYQNLVNTAWHTFRFHYTHPIYEIEYDPELVKLYKGIQLNKIWNFIHEGPDGEPESDVDIYEDGTYCVYAKIKDSYDQDSMSMNKAESYQIMYIYPKDSSIDSKGEYIKYDSETDKWTDKIPVWTEDNPPTGDELLNNELNAGIISLDSDEEIRYLAHNAISIFSALEFEKDRYLCPNDALVNLKSGTIVNRLDIETPLTFTALENNVEIVLHTGIRSFEYSTDGGNEWHDYQNQTTVQLNNISDTCAFRCKDVYKINYSNNDSTDIAKFTISNQVDISGNLNSMLQSDFKNITELQSYDFYEMFKNCASIKKVTAILPSTNLAAHCYESMFEGCTSLEIAPVLKAIKLETDCYKNTFKGCNSIKEIVIYAIWNDSKYTKDWLDGAGSNASSKTIWCNASYGKYPSDASGIPDGWSKESLSKHASYCHVSYMYGNSYIKGYIDERHLDRTSVPYEYITNTNTAIRNNAGKERSSFIGVGNVGWIDFDYTLWKKFSNKLHPLTMSERNYSDLYESNKLNFGQSLYSGDGNVYTYYKSNLTEDNLYIYGIFDGVIDLDTEAPQFDDSKRFKYILSSETFNHFFETDDNIPAGYNKSNYFDLDVPIVIYINNENKVYIGKDKDPTSISIDEFGYTKTPSIKLDAYYYDSDNNAVVEYDLRKNTNQPDGNYYWSSSQPRQWSTFPQNVYLKSTSSTSLYKNIEKLFDSTPIYTNNDNTTISNNYSNNEFVCNTDIQSLGLGFLEISNLYTDYGITYNLCTIIEKDINGESLLDNNGNPLVWYDSIEDKYWNGYINQWQSEKPVRSNATMYDAATNKETPVSDTQGNIIMPDGSVIAYSDFYTAPYNLGIIRKTLSATNDLTEQTILVCYYDDMYIGGGRYCIPNRTSSWLTLDELHNSGYRIVNGTTVLYNGDSQEDLIYDDNPSD